MTLWKKRLFALIFPVFHFAAGPVRAGVGAARRVDRSSSDLLILALCRGIGDFALFYAPYRQICRLRPDLKSTIVVHPRLASACSLLCPGARVLRFSGWMDLWRELRNAQYRYAVDLAAEASWAAPVLLLWLRAGTRAGLYHNLRGILYDRPVRYAGDRSIQEMWFELLAPLGVQAAPFLPLSPDRIGPCARWVRELRLAGRRPAVAIHPGGRDDLDTADKRWPAEAFGRLAGMLAGIGARVLVLGTACEEQLCESVVRMSGNRAENLAGRTSLPDLVHILRDCAVAVCNNSGVLHLAALTGVPTISFAGPVVIERWRPIGAGGRHFIVPNSWGDEHAEFSDPRERAVAQLRSISPERVFPVVVDQLRRSQKLRCSPCAASVES